MMRGVSILLILFIVVVGVLYTVVVNESFLAPRYYDKNIDTIIDEIKSGSKIAIRDLEKKTQSGDGIKEIEEYAYALSGDCGTYEEADTNGDGKIDVQDLTNVIVDWETNGNANNGDVNNDGIVNVQDLTLVIVNWGTLCECVNGLDDDDDGAIDYPSDSDCEGEDDNDESDEEFMGFEEIQILSSELGNLEKFGGAIDIYEDTAIIGTIGLLNNAYVYVKNGDSWEFQQILEPPDTTNKFGHSVAIYEDVVVVGARDDGEIIQNGGAAYVYRFQNDNWDFEQKLTIPIAYSSSASPFMGFSVDTFDNTIIAGAPFLDVNCPYCNNGGVFVYNHFPNNPVGEQWELTQFIQAPDWSEDVSHFGRSLSFEGNTMTIGVPGLNVNGVSAAGAVYVFKLNQFTNEWTFTQKIIADDLSQDEAFGSGVDLNGGVLAVGATDTGNLQTGDGAAYVFQYKSDTDLWQQQVKLIPESEIGGNNEVGNALDIDNGILVIGVPLSNVEYDFSVGSSYVYIFHDQQWELAQTLHASDGQKLNYFGASVALLDNKLLVGAPYKNEMEGAVYTYQTNAFTNGICGNGMVQLDEQCDDGNPPEDGDGCNEFCQVEYTFLCQGEPSTCQVIDFDNDGIFDGFDNCPEIFNPQQEDNENDEIGDVCDSDDDNDFVFDDGDYSGTIGDNTCIGGETVNCDDNCVFTYNPDQSDSDDDGIGDDCDSAFCGNTLCEMGENIDVCILDCGNVARVFVTNEYWFGGGDINMVAGADFKCQDAASTNEFLADSEWKAWISDSQISAAQRLQHHTGPFVLLDGSVIADNWEDLVNCGEQGEGVNCIDHTISITENYNEINSGIETVYTGTAPTGLPALGGFGNNWCLDWTSSNSNNKGYLGKTSEQGELWTQSSGPLGCNSLGRLYCFEQV